MSRRTPVLYRIVESFFRHRLLFILSLIIVTGITMSVLLMRGKTYTATANTQIVTQDVASVLGNNQKTNWVTPAQQNVNEFNDLVNDDLPGGFLDNALKSAGLAVPINVDPRVMDPRYDSLRKHLTANAQSDNLFAINLVWNNQQECEQIVSALQKQYIDEIGLSQAAVSTATGRFLDSQIEDYRTRMQRAESALIEYKTNNAGQLPDIQSAALSQLSSLQAQLDDALITAQGNTLRKDQLQKELATIPAMTIKSQVAAQSPYMGQLNAMEMQLDALKAKYTDDHPEVIKKRDEIANFRKQYLAKMKIHAPEAGMVTQNEMTTNPQYSEVQQQLTDAKITEESQNAQVANLRKRIAQYQTQVSNMPTAQKALNDKTRDYSILKTEYDHLLAQREEIRMKQHLDKVAASSTLQAIGIVYAEPTMNHTKKAMMLVGSVVLGLIVGIVLLILSEWSDNSLRYEGDTEHLLGVPVLAALPDASDLRYLSGSAKNGRGGRKLLSAPTAPPLAAPTGAGAMNATATEG